MHALLQTSAMNATTWCRGASCTHPFCRHLAKSQSVPYRTLYFHNSYSGSFASPLTPNWLTYTHAHLDHFGPVGLHPDCTHPHPQQQSGRHREAAEPRRGCGRAANVYGRTCPAKPLHELLRGTTRRVTPQPHRPERSRAIRGHDTDTTRPTQRASVPACAAGG